MCSDFYPEAGGWLSSECLSFLLKSAAHDQHYKGQSKIFHRTGAPTADTGHVLTKMYKKIGPWDLC